MATGPETTCSECGASIDVKLGEKVPGDGLCAACRPLAVAGLRPEETGVLLFLARDLSPVSFARLIESSQPFPRRTWATFQACRANEAQPETGSRADWAAALEALATDSTECPSRNEALELMERALRIRTIIATQGPTAENIAAVAELTGQIMKLRSAAVKA